MGKLHVNRNGVLGLWAGRTRVLQPKKCPGCKEEFQPKCRHQKFCRNECRLRILHENGRRNGGFFGRRNWTEDEDRVIRNFETDKKKPIEDALVKLTALLPSRTKRAIFHRIGRLRLSTLWHPHLGSLVWSSERKEYQSRRMMGEGNHFYGKKHTEETVDIIRTKMKNGSSSLRRLNKDPEFQAKRRKAWAKSSGHGAYQNKAELALERLIEFASPGIYRYVGDGSFILDGLNPDWVCEEKRKIIELFGRAFHDPKSCIWHVPERRTERGRKRVFRKSGYKTLVIWDDFLKDENNHQAIVEKVRKFTQK